MGPQGSVFEGKTLDEAVRKGLAALGLSRAEVMITMLEEGSGGFLGFGARPYKVRVAARPGGAMKEPESRESGDRTSRDRGRGGRDRERGRGGRDRGRGGREGGREGAREGAREGGRETGREERRVAASGDRNDRTGRTDDRRGEAVPAAERTDRGDGRRGGRDGRHRRDERGGATRTERPRAPREERPAAAAPIETPAAASPPRAADAQGPDEGRRRRRRGRRGGRGRSGAEGPLEINERETPFASEPARSDSPREPRNAESLREPAAVDSGREPRAFEAEHEPAYAEPTRETRYTEPDSEPRYAEPVRESRRSEPDMVEQDAPAPMPTAARGDRDGRRERPGRRDQRSEQSAVATTMGEESGMTTEQLAAEGKRWTEQFLTAMGFQATVTSRADADRVDVTANVTTDEHLLTGPKGETRDALQHLLNRMVNRGEGSRYHLQLEINDFWHQREVELETLARSMAEDALSRSDEIVSEYLNAQERRIIHVTLREDTRVKTYALGTGMIKRIAVAPANFEGGSRPEDE